MAKSFLSPKVLYFTNPSAKDYDFYWNSIKYTFPAQSTSVFNIGEENYTANVELRKRAAYGLAVREYMETPAFRERENKDYIPALYVEKNVFQPYIDKCLEPMKEAQVDIQLVEGQEIEKELTKTTKPIDEAGGFESFRNDPRPTYGIMPTL